MKKWIENGRCLSAQFKAFLGRLVKPTGSKGGVPATVSEFQQLFRVCLGKKSGLPPRKFKIGPLARNGRDCSFSRKYWEWFKEHRYALIMALKPFLTEETATKIVGDTIAEFNSSLRFPASGQPTIERFQNGP
jgi:hypothetical protein